MTKMITLPDGTEFPHRTLADGQACVVHVVDTATGEIGEVYRTTEVLLEAPNWVGDTLILNGDGELWRLALGSGELTNLPVPGLPDLNNDHCVHPLEPATLFVSCFDWHLYRVGLRSGTFERVTADDPDRAILHFLHGVSPDGDELAFVGVEPGEGTIFGPANIFTVPSSGGPIHQLTFGNSPADGPEYTPDGEWIYFNTEAFSSTPGHAQIARMRRDGSELTQLTFDERVNWFPHFAPDGTRACYLSYPTGTTGHPADLDVELRLATDDDWANAVSVAAVFGGQGTINVNSWSADSRRFAFVSYPVG